MYALFTTLHLALDIYFWFIIASAVFSWLYAFNIVNPNNQFVGQVGSFLHQITEPALRPIRRFLPNLGTIDISPIVLILAIFFIQNLLRFTVAPAFGVRY